MRPLATRFIDDIVKATLGILEIFGKFVDITVFIAFKAHINRAGEFFNFIYCKFEHILIITCYNGVMDRNFKVRVAVGSGMFIIALVALYTFESIPFKIIYGLFSMIAAAELVSFLKLSKVDAQRILLMLCELVFLVGGVVFVARVDLGHFWYIILGVPGYDIFAYLFGKIFGGKVFGKSRPFPKISKNKTWEGTILGLMMSTGMVVILMAVRGSYATDWMYILCGPLALAGDLFESFLKRRFKVKDSNEVVIKNKFFRALENLVGGSEGHGGFLDRVDSTAFTTTILLIISLVVAG